MTAISEGPVWVCMLPAFDPKWWEFDGKWTHDNEQALQACRICPALALCKKQTRQQRIRPEGVIQAGKVYQPKPRRGRRAYD